MAKISGITVEKDVKGKPRYVRIDLRKHGNNELLEDFLDIQAANAVADEETKPWSEVRKKLTKKHGLK